MCEVDTLEGLAKDIREDVDSILQLMDLRYFEKGTLDHLDLCIKNFMKSAEVFYILADSHAKNLRKELISE